jgi:putative DNA primase/helicase
MDFFTSIQDTDEMRDFVIDLLAVNLHGHKRDQLIVFWIGKGGNGKGVTIILYQGALGEYLYCPPIELYTTKRKSASQANPEMAKAKGVRAMISTEPEQDDVIYVGVMKAITGGDKQQGRQLFANPIEFTLSAHPSFK